MPQGTSISFVIFPDGKLDEQSITVSGERVARERCICAWLPEQYFGRTSIGYVADTLWKTMRDKGFRVYTIRVDKDGVPTVAST